MIERIRNDDVAADTRYEALVQFCAVCDQHGVALVHAVTPLGLCIPVEARMTNDRIVAVGGARTLADNPRVVAFLRGRPDAIAVHGLWHTHGPSPHEVALAAALLRELGLAPTRFSPPFNEGTYAPVVAGLTLYQALPPLEEFLDGGDPQRADVYLHSWRLDREPRGLARLDACLARLQRAP